MSSHTLSAREVPEHYLVRRRYEQLGESYIDWVGQVPKHWGRTVLQRVARENNRRNRGIGVANVLSLSYGKIVRRDVTTNEGLLPDSFDTYQIVDPGEIVLRLTDLQNDQRSLRVGLVQERGIITSAYLGLQPSDSCSPKYLYYLLHAADIGKVFYRMGAGVRQTLDYFELRKLGVVLPTMQEQFDIAEFLDIRTARIDLLVQKKERLVELLVARRSALIRHMVAGGVEKRLSSDFEAGDSTTLFPSKWVLWKLRYLASVSNGSTPDRDEFSYWADGDFPWLTSGKINDEVIHGADEFVTPKALRECHLPVVPKDSVLVAITGEGQTRGRAALLKIESTISQHLAAIVPRGNRMKPEYLFRLLQSMYEWLRWESSGGGTTRAALTCEFLSSVRVPIPPLDEQDRIVEDIRDSIRRIDGLVELAQNGIEKLHDFREALVWAAVTGKIDVRSSGHS